jgi:hypothetical protein
MRDRRRIVGALVIVDRDQAIHESAGGHHGDVAKRAAPHLLLAGEPFAPEALSITHHRIELGVGNRLEHVRRLREIGGKRFFDQHRHATLDRGQDRSDTNARRWR